jgi:hypothetical protein
MGGDATRSLWPLAHRGDTFAGIELAHRIRKQQFYFGRGAMTLALQLSIRRQTTNDCLGS